MRKRFFKYLLEDMDSMIRRDPAARSRWEIAFLYPGFHSLLFHRLGHQLWHWQLYFLARWVSQLGRWLTGIEIHPAAIVGRGLFIDHGMGVVIGETAEIGQNVTLYHGVTLGGVSPAIESNAQIRRKRHPTLEDDVIVGSGAQILGPITIGRCARVGANAVVIKDVAPGVTVVGIPARPLGKARSAGEADFAPYGIAPGVWEEGLRNVQALREELLHMQERLAQLEAEPACGATQEAQKTSDPPSLPPASSSSVKRKGSPA